MTIIKGSDGSWTWNGGKEGAQRFDELAQAEALAKFDGQTEACAQGGNCGGIFVRRASSTRSSSERCLSSRVVATLLANSSAAPARAYPPPAPLTFQSWSAEMH